LAQPCGRDVFPLPAGAEMIVNRFPAASAQITGIR
jgi:hypothetical protein